VTKVSRHKTRKKHPLGDVCILDDGSELEKEIRPVSTIFVQKNNIFYFFSLLPVPSTLSPERESGSFLKSSECSKEHQPTKGGEKWIHVA
jgi:hypothetical protein